MKDVIPSSQEIKDSGIKASELLAGVIASHVVRTKVTSENKFINPVVALASLLVHAKSKNLHVQNIMLGVFTYFGIKSLNDLKVAAVNGLQGVNGMEGVREMLNKIVPSLGDAEVELLSGQELINAERELLGIINGGSQEFTPFTDVTNEGISGVGNL